MSNVFHDCCVIGYPGQISTKAGLPVWKFFFTFFRENRKWERLIRAPVEPLIWQVWAWLCQQQLRQEHVEDDFIEVTWLILLSFGIVFKNTKVVPKVYQLRTEPRLGILMQMQSLGLKKIYFYFSNPFAKTSVHFHYGVQYFVLNMRVSFFKFGLRQKKNLVVTL